MSCASTTLFLNKIVKKLHAATEIQDDVIRPTITPHVVFRNPHVRPGQTAEPWTYPAINITAIVKYVSNK